jgi:bifunctional non-homologous end joining protein LigD
MPARRGSSEPSRKPARKREPAAGDAQPAPRCALAARGVSQEARPERTTEPFGGAVAGTPTTAPPAGMAPALRFIVQEHWARNLHFDLRLELDGVLKSWAVPKGPSVRAEEKRLAVHVEDHPLEYANFEGVIPSGNYGAGSVIVWDRGTYRSFKPESVRELYERGLIEIELFGHKLGGKWTLVRTRSQKEWLLLKKKDAAAADVDAIERWPRSVITGLTVQEMKDANAWLAALRAHVESKRAPRGEVRAAQVKHMLATLTEKPFTRKGLVVRDQVRRRARHRRAPG